MKQKLLLFDNCLIGICNMGCMYCRKKSFEIIAKNKIKTNDEIIDLKQLKDKLIKITLSSQKFFDIPILKISGYGEFFVLPDTIKTLKKLSKNYERIQIITNATKLNEKIISKLAKIKGINICVSLDGHTPELNHCRTTDKFLIKKILNNIELLQKYKIPVEINSVITKYNISKFVDFVKYLSKYNLICYPYPVREHDNLSALRKDVKKIEPLLDKKILKILPHKEYIKRLISFIKNGKRQEKCYVGYVNLGIIPDGNIPICACNIKQSVGNIFKDLNEFKRRKSKIFNKFIYSQFNDCNNCFTHYEIINLYLDGTLKDISKIHLFSGKKTQKRLKELKNLTSTQLT